MRLKRHGNPGNDRTSHAPAADGPIHDVGIIGGGPAGLSAALWSARYLHSVVLIDSGDPRNWETRGINGYLGSPRIRPPQLRERGRRECRRYGVELVDGTVLRVEPCDQDLFALHADGGIRFRVRRLVLAVGIKDVWPSIPGLARVYGKSAHVCPDCDGYEARGRRVMVIGTGRRAVGMALDLTTWTDDITICTNGREPRLAEGEYREKLTALGIRVVQDPITCVRYRGSRVTSLELEGGRLLRAERVFFTLAQYPADDLCTQLGCERDRGGHILVTQHQATSVPSVFAAGDITPGPQLAVRAASAGAVAALAIHKSLVPPERKLARARTVPEGTA
jgi:thioredoxin reductase